MSTVTQETWLPIPGYEGMYEVSDLGGVRNGRGPMKPSADRLGYIRVGLGLGGGRRTLAVHRLVLLAFVGPPGDGQECRHLDGDRSNNRLANLSWGTPSQNERDKVRHGTHHEAAKSSCPRDHAYDYRNAKGKRICLTCKREKARRASGLTSAHEVDNTPEAT